MVVAMGCCVGYYYERIAYSQVEVLLVWYREQYSTDIAKDLAVVGYSESGYVASTCVVPIEC